MPQLKNKIAVVSGGTSGIGLFGSAPI